jgi:hypothetical protein
MSVLRELARYKLDIVGVQEVRRNGGGTEPVGEYTFFYGKGSENHELGTGFFVHERIISAVTRLIHKVSFPLVPQLANLILREATSHT